ncbi:MAG: hypothetical protein JW855_04745 [Gammaproteobacteria bacterium]|nr:hypothetical protein [Gammaproteobacteria bacterium]
MKKTWFHFITFLLFLILILFVVGVALKKGEVSRRALLPKHMVLFYSNQCEHCKHVEKFLSRHHLTKPLQKLDVLKNQKNIQMLIDTARVCGGNTSTIGIPLLWTGGECISGDVGVINYLKRLEL